jgi:hypothetical protein
MASDQQTTACPGCDDAGHFAAFVDREDKGHFDPALRCFLCGGSGRVSAQTAEWHARGRALRDARRSRGESVFDLAKRLGLSSSQVSAMEVGLADSSPLEVADD